MKKVGLCLIIFVFTSLGAVWAQDISLTLDEAVALALRDNRDILLKAEEIEKAKAKIAESRSGFFPTLNLTGTLSDTLGYYGKDLIQENAQLTLKEYFYKGGKNVNTLEQNKNKLAVSEALLDKEKLETVLEVKKAFYAFLLANDFTGLNKKILENTHAHLAAQKVRYENGEASESDILRIESSFFAVKEAYALSESQIEAVVSLLRDLLYLDESVNITPEGKLIFAPREVAFEEAFLKAIEMRPEIRQYAAQEEADKKAIEINKAETRPSVYASWDYYARSHSGATTSRNPNDYSVLGVTISWPVFDGWAAKYKVEQAIIDLKETRLTKEKAIKDIILELKEAYLALKNVLSAMKAKEAEAALYKDSLSVIKEKYAEGLASALDLSDAEVSYAVSLFNKEQAVFDYLLAKADFDKASGGSR